MVATALLAGYSRSEIVTSLVFAFLFAALGYRMSRRHRLVRGVTPWRLPSAVWALICFVLQPFGLIVEIFAQATTRPAIPPPARVPTYPGPVARGAAFGTGGPASVLDVSPAAPPVPAGPPPPASDSSGRPALFGWYPDTTGRHELRYWDGRGWTAHVRDGDRQATDPV
jgi:hypothetical protein